MAHTCVALPILAAGCHSSSPHSEPASAILSVGGSGLPAVPPRDQSFDFGSVLALGQTLQHEFNLANPSDRPIRLLGATALTPCCSGISPLPGVIPPRSEIKARVSFKPGFQSEGKRVEFEILTDSREWPVLRLAVSARIVSPWEIQPDHPDQSQVKLSVFIRPALDETQP